MTFLGKFRQLRRETKLQVKAATAKAKEAAKHEAKLRREVHKERVKADKRAAKAAQKDQAKQNKRAQKADLKVRKQEQKLDARAQKRLEKIRRKEHKDEQKSLKAKHKHQQKMAEKILEQQRNSGFTADKAKSAIGGARLLIPLAIPFAYRGATWLQNRSLNNDAKKFGVSGKDAARHYGHGAPLRARIEKARESLKTLQESGPSNSAGFVTDARKRLDLLNDGLNTAERMTPEQRRRAYKSIVGELDTLDAEILKHMGLN